MEHRGPYTKRNFRKTCKLSRQIFMRNSTGKNIYIRKTYLPFINCSHFLAIIEISPKIFAKSFCNNGHQFISKFNRDITQHIVKSLAMINKFYSFILNKFIKHFCENHFFCQLKKKKIEKFTDSSQNFREIKIIRLSLKMFVNITRKSLPMMLMRRTLT